MTMLSARRSVAVTSALLTGALVLSACSDNGEDQNAEDDAEALSETGEALVPEAEGDAEYPMTIDTAHGPAEIEERPERVAVLGWNPNHDAAAALGVTPVYAASRSFDYGWMDEEWLDSIETLEEREDTDVNLEGVAASDPDLIFLPNTAEMFEEEDIERLSEIAPVLEDAEVVPGDQVDWRDAPRLLGEALDLEEAAETAISEAESAMEATAEEHPEFEGRTITLATDYGEEYGIEYYTAAGGTAEEITTLLGFEPNPLAEQFSEDAVVSEENQSELDADALIMFYAEDSIRENREDSELFNQIPAVEDDRYTSVVATEDERAEGGAVWVLRRGASVESLPWMLEALADWVDDADLES
ncbi:ABC transporter substrate-binding protein [Nesterenkonia populi]